MGILRTLLAIAVVLSHAVGGGLIGGRNAVQMFYVISGFLISFVLTETRAYPSIRAFYVNRYLRLYPIYFIVAAATLLMLWIQSGGDVVWEVYRRAPDSARALLSVANATLFGQDWVMFSGVREGQLTFVRDFNASDPILYPGLLVPQAWTLGVELSFYLVAPFILPHRRLICLLVVLSLGLRLVLIKNGLGLADPWTYRFFPTELALFLLGSLSHQMLSHRYRKMVPEHLSFISTTSTGLLVLVCCTYGYIPGPEWMKTICLFTLFIPAVPLLFEYQKRNPLDRRIGDLSFPIYINHMLVIGCVEASFIRLHIESKTALALLSIGLSLVVAVALDRVVGAPMERLRAKVKQRKNLDASTTAPLIAHG